MKSNPLLKQIFGVTLSTLLFIPFCFVGCGASEDDNTQPSIETIIDQTLNAGDETKVEVTITDADRDDTHIMSASSDDTTIATVSVMGRALTIKAITAGTSTITVSAIDDSGQGNAAAIAAVFKITVIEPWVGTWRLETVDGQSFEQALAEEGVNVSIVTNNWTFNSDGTMEAELAAKIEVNEEGFEFSGGVSTKYTGTYSLHGSNYTLTITVKGVGIEGNINETNQDTGTWSREGNTLILFSDAGETIVFRKK